MKEVRLMFYKVNPSEKNTGMKLVMWRVTTTEGITDDWGFAEWTGKEWSEIDLPPGITAKVIYWANTPNPEVLTLEKRIIT